MRTFILSLSLFAALIMTAPAAMASTTVDVGWFAAFAATYILPAIGGLVALVLGHLLNILKQKWRLDIDANQREALQTALTNAAGLLVHQGVKSLEGKTIDVKSEAVAAAIAYVEAAAPAALAHFGLSPTQVAEKIAAKLSQIMPTPAVEAVTAETAAK